MTLNAAMLVAALMLSGTVLAQSSGPSAGGRAESGVTTTGQAPAPKTGDSGPAVAQASRPAKPDTGAASNTVSVNRGPKTDRRREHFP
ncbi:hypothetical protein UP09_26920 [Bradyrhizobium sp. LTSP885]|uniref:hypothetical protein n=1 Tax=Bradyrhizobium sp. LTSP885 TaxID=1619232 RepID=UPI0005C8CFE3|nr:hypothetical protein [Bradyrhizobium sp. LTSP885]KJC38078.1 hypothetical protein UP09_26920 [Bradyrhizobium sp. LTSP885]